MRTSSVLGASSLRRTTATRVLVAGLLAMGLAALGAAPASAVASTGGNGHGGSHSDGRSGSHRDGHVGSRWDGGKARVRGVEYSWPSRTFDYVGNTCPELDSGKIDLKGESATLTITAEPDKLISSYCIKSGSDNRGEGPKIVELDEPVASLTIAYPVGGRCKNISHYAVAYVDAAEPSSPPEDAETPSPEEPETPNPEDSETPAPQAIATPTPTPGVTPSAPVKDVVSTETTPPTQTPAAGAAASPTPTPTPSATASAAVVPVDDTAPTGPAESGRLAATDDAPAVRDAGRLAFTGAQVAGVLVAAVVLVAIGTLAIHASRRRADARA